MAATSDRSGERAVLPTLVIAGVVAAGALILLGLLVGLQLNRRHERRLERMLAAQIRSARQSRSRSPDGH